MNFSLLIALLSFTRKKLLGTFILLIEGFISSLLIFVMIILINHRVIFLNSQKETRVTLGYQQISGSISLSQSLFKANDLKELKKMNPELSFLELYNPILQKSIINVNKRYTAYLGAGVTPGYLTSYQLSILSGRLFDQKDITFGKNLILISQNLAQIIFKNDNPIGKTLLLPNILNFEDSGKAIFHVIGVFEDIAKGSKLENHSYFVPFFEDMEAQIRFRGTEDGEKELDRISETFDSIVNYYKVVAKSRIGSDNFQLSLTTSKDANLDLIVIIAASILCVTGVSYSTAIFICQFSYMNEQIKSNGIRLTLGASRIAIAVENLAPGFVFSSLGSILGVAVAPLIINLFSADSRLFVHDNAVTMVVTPVLVTIAMALICTLCSAYPMFFAFRLRPVEALREL